jgi:hypothetical protein
MNLKSINKLLGLAVSAALLLGLSGCLSDDSSSSTSTTLSGTAMAGPFLNGTVCAYQISNGAKGAALGTCANLASSTFNIDIGSYTGDVLVEISNASYDDEANPADDITGTTLTGTLGNLVHIATPGGTVDLAVTPFTEAALRLAGTLNNTAVQTAIGQLAALLPLDPNLDLRVTPPVSTTALGLTYREALRALSQLQWGMAGAGQFAGDLNGFLGDLVGQVSANTFNTIAADFLVAINSGLNSNCTLTNNVLTCTLPTGGGGTGGGGTGGSIACNTALFQAGAVRDATSTELTAYAKTYSGNTGSFDQNFVFTPDGNATLVFGSSGTLTFNSQSQTVTSICYETAAPQLVVHFGAFGHVDLMTNGSFTGVSPDGMSIIRSAP